MKKVAVEQAVGRTLCHDITVVRDGFKGAAFRRGQVITQADIPALLDAGKRFVYIWEETAGEIHEEDAARRLAAMTPVEGVAYSPVSEGKTVLTAERDGLFLLNVPLLEKINAIGEITIATVPNHYPVRAGETLASMRIVPLVCAEAEIERAEALCRARGPLYRLAPYRRGLKAGALITGSEVYHGRIADRFEPVLRQKLAAFGAEILEIALCDDDPEMLQAGIRRLLDAGAELILMTGGMSVDPDDLTPAAIRASGAEVVKQGIPAQPGNMLMVAYHGDTAIVGVPGAAIHRPVTMLDVVLPQIFAGIPLTRADLIRIGQSGLCRQCGDCRWPNCMFGRY